jgi:hypothetical protein
VAEFHLLRLAGETRGAVVEGGRLVEMHMSRDGDGLAAGARVAARLVKRLGGRGIADVAGEELVVEPWPAGASEGATVVLEVTRAAWREPGRDRLAKARPVRKTGREAAAPVAELEARLRARGLAARPGWPDEVAAAWEAGFEAAELGRVAFAGGSLSFTPTPACVTVDVDGAGGGLAVPALEALARTLRLWGLGGSIVVDVPAAGRGERLAAAEAFDAAMGSDTFERTSINGFGLMQVVRPREGPSVLERARLDRAGSGAVALLELARRAPPGGPLRLVARGDIIGWIGARPQLVAEVARAAGRTIALRADAAAGGGHVEPA